MVRRSWLLIFIGALLRLALECHCFYRASVLAGAPPALLRGAEREKHFASQILPIPPECQFLCAPITIKMQPAGRPACRPLEGREANWTALLPVRILRPGTARSHVGLQYRPAACPPGGGLSLLARVWLVRWRWLARAPPGRHADESAQSGALPTLRQHNKNNNNNEPHTMATTPVGERASCRRPSAAQIRAHGLQSTRVVSSASQAARPAQCWR